MRRATLLFLLLLLGGRASGTATIQAGTQLGAGSQAGYYEVTVWAVNYTTIAINSTHINISGFDASDVYSNTSGLWGSDTTEVLLTAIPSDELLYIHDFIQSTSSITVDNVSGNLTDFSICYTSTTEGNITLGMDDLDGDCNYKATAQSGNSSSIADIRYPRNIAALAECDPVVLVANSTAGTYCITVAEDPTTSEAKLSSIIAAAAVAITTIIHVLKWDSET